MEITQKLEKIDAVRRSIKQHEDVIADIQVFKSETPTFNNPDADKSIKHNLLHRHSLISKMFGLIGFKQHEPGKGGGHLTDHAEFNYDMELLENLESFFDMRLWKLKDKLGFYLKNVGDDD